MAYFVESSSDYSESEQDEEPINQTPKGIKQPARPMSKRTKQLPATLRDDYIPTTTKEEEKLQKGMLSPETTSRIPVC